MKIHNSHFVRRRGKLKTIVLTGLVLLGLLVSVWLISTGGCSDPAANVMDAGTGDAKEVQPTEAAQGDLTFELDGENTDIKWTGSNSIGQKPTGYFYELTGAATVGEDQGNRSLKSLILDIDINGMQAMSQSLTKKLKHKGFFEVDKFPKATFTSTSIHEIKTSDESTADSDGATHLIEGNFQLRDVTQSIRMPVRYEATTDSLTVSSQFKINRRDYGVVYSDAAGDKLIRDSVLIDLSIASSAAETHRVKQANDATPLAATPTKTPLENYTETIKTTLVEFDMVLVAGDPALSAAPFWIGKTEVTWEEFDYWALCKNMADKDSIKEISQLLRPSAPHDLEKIYRGWGREKQPVVGVSKRSAELYCQWLSQQTGKTYRLPTDAEWDRAFELGGGDLNAPLDRKALAEIAWFADNALSTDDEGFDFERAMPVATRKANRLGIHDMLGNAAEWVSTAGQTPAVRGGNFKLPAQELIGGHRESEDQGVWNRDYPQEPKSQWWYVNADHVGFRVVCDPTDESQP